MLVQPLWKMTLPVRSGVVVRLTRRCASARVRIRAGGICRPIWLTLPSSRVTRRSLRASRVALGSPWAISCWIALITPLSRISSRSLLPPGAWISLPALLLPPLLRLPVLLPLAEARILASAVLVSTVPIILISIIRTAIASAIPKATIAVTPRLRGARFRRALAAVPLSQRRRRRQHQQQRCSQRRSTHFPRIGKAGHRSHSRLRAAYSCVATAVPQLPYPDFRIPEPLRRSGLFIKKKPP